MEFKDFYGLKKAHCGVITLIKHNHGTGFNVFSENGQVGAIRKGEEGYRGRFATEYEASQEELDSLEQALGELNAAV